LALGVVQVRACRRKATRRVDTQGRRGRDTGSYVDRGERREVRAWAARSAKRFPFRGTLTQPTHSPVASRQPLLGVPRDAELPRKVDVPMVSVPKVSVIVPTFALGDRLNRVVRSLGAQTLREWDFEVIFVDDGSPDDTWERLQHIRDTHMNVRIERIEHSGLPSKPRNVGLELARGEYVLFMDHDDELYPRALEAGYAMAARNHADVLNGKETRTDQSKWAIEVYTANIDNAIDRQDVHPLFPTNPHKLFRREFLIEHRIRFPEGRRVLWEDVFFALDIAPHAKVISVLADTPFYHWVRGRKRPHHHMWITQGSIGTGCARSLDTRTRSSAGQRLKANGG
jgi:hypothetical protein